MLGFVNSFFSPYQYFLLSLYHRPLTPATAAVVGRLSSQGLLKIEAERERQRESLCCFNGEEISELKCLWFHCLFSKLKSCLPLFEQWVSEAWSASSLWFSTCREGRCLHLSKVLLLLGVVFPSFFFYIWQPLRQETRRYSDSVMSKCHPLMLSVL